MSDALQFFGGLFEIGGLATVALGIVETRRAFTNRPGLLQKVARSVARFVARFAHQPDRTMHEVGATLSAEGAVSVSAHLRYGFKGSLDDRVNRLQEIAQEHENRLDKIDERIDSESEKLRTDIRSLQTALRDSEQKLMERVSEAAANGLTLESWGVFLFIIGVALTTWGGVIA